MATSAQPARWSAWPPDGSTQVRILAVLHAARKGPSAANLIAWISAAERAGIGTRPVTYPGAMPTRWHLSTSRRYAAGFRVEAAPCSRWRCGRRSGYRLDNTTDPRCDGIG